MWCCWCEWVWEDDVRVSVVRRAGRERRRFRCRDGSYGWCVGIDCDEWK